MSDERQSLLGGPKGSNRRRHNRKPYTKSDGPAAIEMTQSGSSTGSLAGIKGISSGRSAPRLSNAFENSGVYQIALSWKDIGVKVNIPGKKAFLFGQSQPSVQKTILRNITGIAQPGCLLAIMGASGSGKSTLLNVLTQRNVKDYTIEGEMMLNGVPLTPGAIKNVSAYVQQHDLFMENLTVREQLQFRAMLRMDKKLDKEARMKRVEEVIAEMGLNGCVHSRIGSHSGTKKGISGGERKRLGFASEALSNPPIFFCDEPTSSLDTFMAQSIVKTLKNMAARGRVILCTIHQPSSELFALFDQVLILSEGEVSFMGSAKGCLDFFSGQGYPCPRNYNPSDHYILTLAIVPGNEQACRQKSQAICESFKKSEQAKNIEEQISEQKREVDMYDHVVLAQVTGESRYASKYSDQVRNLFWRAWISQFRDMQVMYVRLAQVLIISLILGLVYLDQDVNQKSILNINGALFLVLVNSAFTNMFAVLTSFPNEMQLVKREYGTGLYGAATYFISKSISEVPVYVGCSFVFTTISYWMIGFYDDFESYATACIVVILGSFVAVCLGYAISILTGETTLALSIGGPALIPAILFSGMTLNLDDIPGYLKWMKELSWFKNGFQLLMVNQWDNFDTIPCSNSSDIPMNGSLLEICNALSCRYPSGQAIVEYYGLEDEQTRDFLQMLGIGAGLYIVALIGLVRTARRSRE